MTDIEISKQLALAIGWKKSDMRKSVGKWWVYPIKFAAGYSRPFDYRDWNVIGPIAAKYDCFPFESDGEWVATSNQLDSLAKGDTPQKAIAMAVIKGKKRGWR